MESALESYRRALHLASKGSSTERRLHMRIGTVLTWQGKYQDALEEFNQVTGIGAFDGTGRVRFLMGELKAAENEFLRAINGSATYGNAHNGLGRVHLEQGKLQEAEANFKEAEKCLNASAKNMRLLHRSSLGLWWENYLPWDPHPYWIIKNLGMAQLLLGRTQDALNAFWNAEQLAKKRLSEVGEDFAAKYTLVIALLGRDEAKLAIEALEEAMKLCTAKGVVEDFLKDIRLLKKVAFLRNHAESMETIIDSVQHD